MSLRSIILGSNPAAVAQAALDVQTAVLTDGTSFDIGTGPAVFGLITPEDLELTAAKTGKYAISYAVHGNVDGNPTPNEIYARLTRNGTAIPETEIHVVRSEADNNDQGTGSNIIYADLVAGDVIRVEVAQETNAAFGAVLSNGAGRSSLSLRQIS